MTARLHDPRLERAIGVVYRPDTERQSHYFRARLAEQFDAVLHFDETRAVEPLERTAQWDAGELPEDVPLRGVTWRAWSAFRPAASRSRATSPAPRTPGALVLFAHGSGSSRLSPRNRHVARVLNEATIATLLVDLLTPRRRRSTRARPTCGSTSACSPSALVAATDWLADHPDTRGLRVGYFGASTGAAAALVAAAVRAAAVGAVRLAGAGGRTSPAARWRSCRAPTLL